MLRCGVTCWCCILFFRTPSAEHPATQVKVKRRGDDRKHIARVLAVGVECDMALLTVEEPEFWEGVRAVRFGPLPRLHVLLPAPPCMCASSLALAACCESVSIALASMG